MFERILKIFMQPIQLILQSRFTFSRDQIEIPQPPRVIILCTIIFIRFTRLFIIGQKISEGFVELQFFLLQWYNIPRMCLELLEVLHYSFLGDNEYIDLFGIFSYGLLAELLGVGREWELDSAILKDAVSG